MRARLAQNRGDDLFLTCSLPKSATTEGSIMQKLSVDIGSYFPEKSLTPYGLSKIVNLLLKEVGIEQTLPPQMFYNYSKKGYIKKDASDGRISRDEALAWTEKYLTKKLS